MSADEAPHTCRAFPSRHRHQVTIRGSKRTKLGLRGMVSLGDFTQRIDVAAATARNTVEFALAGGSLLSGALTIDATFTVASPQRCARARMPRAGTVRARCA